MLGMKNCIRSHPREAHAVGRPFSSVGLAGGVADEAEFDIAVGVTSCNCPESVKLGVVSFDSEYRMLLGAVISLVDIPLGFGRC